MRYDPLEIAAAAMFFIPATERPWEEIAFLGDGRIGREWDGEGWGLRREAGGGGGGGNHSITTYSFLSSTNFTAQ